MRRAILAAAVACTAMVNCPVRAEAVVLRPASPWNVDFGAESCRLVRLFGAGEDEHFLSFQQYWPSDRLGLTVAGPSFDDFRSRARTDLRFFEAQTAIRGEPFKGEVERYGTGVIYPTIAINQSELAANDPDVPDERALVLLDEGLGGQVQFIELRQGKRTVRLDTGKLDAAFRVLNQCTVDLLREWGLDPERHTTAQNGPRWTNRDKIVSRLVASYPDAAARQGEQGIMRLRVIVSEQGKTESCVIMKATQTEKLESPACKLMEAATFEPARDAAGQPFRSFYATSITYQMN